MRQARLLRKRQELRKADPQKMAALRQKFLNQAKKYYGYPYAKKYWPPDSPEYKSKLFLDCCGLVRRVMRDLAEDFGFIIGPWNQAYMFDTLPIVVENEKDMKPGDLVFISATYYNPKSKKQRHNMTHVEIWAGEGCKTIGARWNNGKVQMWDNYKFVAKSYHSETYHFRSIDTWLKGICTSHCSQHSWRRSKYSPTKKSIFALPEQIEEDEAAGDDDDNVDTFNMRGNTFISQVSSVNKMMEQCRVSEIDRPKTELDSHPVRNDTPSSRQISAEFQTEFPTIRNDLKKKGKNLLSKKKKVKSDEKQRESPSLVVKGRKGPNGRSEINMVDASEEYFPKTNLLDRGNEYGQLRMSGSLNDLGRKGLYLRDLVDAQKPEYDVEDREEDVDEDIIDEEALGDEDKEDSDYDDDYFIFVNDDEDSDDKEKDNSDDSSEFIMGEDVESDIEKDTEVGDADKHEAKEKVENIEEFSAKEDTEIENKKSYMVQEGHSYCKDTGKENCFEMENDLVMIQQGCTDTDSKSGEKDDMLDKSCNDNDEKPQVKVNIIETVMPFGQAENMKCQNTKISQTGSKGNCNQNANPKVTEKHQSKEKSRGQCLKASVITVVSQPGSSDNQTCSTCSTWPSSNCDQGGFISTPRLSSSQASVTSKAEACRNQACVASNPDACRNQACMTSQPSACFSKVRSVSPDAVPSESTTSGPSANVDTSTSQLSESLENTKSSTGAS